MALTVTARGTYGNNVSGTSLIGVPTSTIATGTLGVFVVATDNSGATGATKIFTAATFNDSVGNTWTRRLNAIYDPANANAGVEVACYTAPIVTQITTSDNITITISTAAVGKTGALWEISGSVGTPTFVTGAASCDGCTSGQTGTATTVTSSSIPTGDAIIGWVGAEINAASTPDSDISNGSWSAEQSTGVNAPMRTFSQYKVVTGAGTQTYNITITSADWEAAWVQFTEVAAGTAIKTALGLVKASVKTVNGLAIASVKTVQGL